MATLILRLPADPSKGADSILRCALDDGSGSPQGFESRLGSLPRGHDVVAVAPASKCSWLRAMIPPGVQGDGPMRSALEGALEETLLDDPSKMHLAPAGLAPDGSTLVLACDRGWLASCLASLAEAGSPAARVVPEFAPGAALGVAYMDEALGERLAAIDATGVRCLPLSMEALPEGASFSCEPSLSRMAEGLGAGPARIVEFATRMRMAADGRTRLDQFEFSTRGWSKWRQSSKALCVEMAMGRAWRPARLGLLALVCALCAVGLGRQWSSASELASKQAKLRDLASRAFPSIKLAIDPPAQMAQELAALRASAGASSPSDLESILSTMGPAGAAAISIAYKDGKAVFKAKPEQINELAAAASSKGLSANARGSVVEIGPFDTNQGASK